MTYDYDVLVVGSGFGGSVTALRATEKGYRVLVVESGKRWHPDDFPRSNWNTRKFLFFPKLGMRGIQRVDLLKDVAVLSGAGVGGGSLVYANTLYVPPEEFFRDPQWAGITDWQDELAPHYDQATRMLGVVTNPTMTPSDVAMKQVADDMGVGHTFQPTPVGVYFGDGPGVPAEDPYFGGAGPQRAGCTECGECMTGCRHGAKNTLDRNYLYLAEQGGAEILPDTTVVDIRPRQQGGYAVDVERAGAWLRRKRRTITAEQVVLAAGALGTQRLLQRLKLTGSLPALSDQLGAQFRTNSEAIIGAVARDRSVDYSKGVAITSSFFPQPDTHVEPCRYGHGQNAMGLLGTVLSEGGHGKPRWRHWLSAVAERPRDLLAGYNMHHWSEKTIIVLVMQHLDNSLRVRPKKRLGGLLGHGITTEHGSGPPNPTFIPAGVAVTRRLAQVVKGRPMGSWTEVFDIPMTAHIIGGCVIGATPADGVIDAYQRVYGYPGMHVVDGSALSANLGVNPSLSITAQAERALALWPNRGEQDARPPLGGPYVRIAPVPPARPAVPDSAPGALRLPFVSVASLAASARSA